MGNVPTLRTHLALLLGTRYAYYRCAMGIFIENPAAALKLLGGPKLVARELQRRPTTVISWGARQSIPVKAWPSLVDLAATKQLEGFTYEALACAHARTRKQGADEPPSLNGKGQH